MNKTKFSKPPLTDLEKEKKAAEFLNFGTVSEAKNPNVMEVADVKERVMKKEPTKQLLVRFPLSLAEDIAEISAITALSMNAVCVELLRPAARNKLKDLKE